MRYVGTRGVPRISNVTLPILLFPPFPLAGHYTGPDIQSRRISFRNTIKGRKRESHPTVEPTSSVCIDDPATTITTTTTTVYACTSRGWAEEPSLPSSRGIRRRGELDQTEFSRPLKFSACTTCWRRPRATDDTGRLGDMRIVIWFLASDAISLILDSRCRLYTWPTWRDKGGGFT